MESVYDPLDYENLAKSVVNALFEKDLETLPLAEAFSGAGVYALYYSGDFKPYAPIAPDFDTFLPNSNVFSVLQKWWGTTDWEGF